jgi:competence protein ComEA
MFKIFLLAFALMLSSLGFAATDVNKATAAELDAVKGIGPAMSTKIIEERKKGNFKDWDDLITRVKGVGEKSAAKLSAGGLTVGDATYKGVAAAPAAASAKGGDKKDAKAAAVKASDAKPAAAKASEAAPAASAAKK